MILCQFPFSVVIQDTLPVCWVPQDNIHMSDAMDEMKVAAKVANAYFLSSAAS